MANQNKTVRLLLAGLKFDRQDLGALGRDAAYQGAAVAWLLALAAWGGLAAFFHGNSGSSGVVRMGLSGGSAALAEAGSLLISTFVSAWVMTWVLRLFRARPAYDGVLRVYAAATVWTAVKYALLLALPGGSTALAILCWLAYNFALWFGLTALTELRYWQTFLGIVLTFLAGFVLMLLYGALLQALLG